MHIGLINNLRAGRSNKQVWRILNLLRSYPHVCHVETDRAGALPDAIADLARRKIDLLIVNGGDGTLQHTLTEILANDVFDRMPMIAPLRGGRTNMTSLDLGAHRDPVKGLRAVLDAAGSGTLHERFEHRPVLRVAYDGGRETSYGMFFGVGMIHRAITLTHQLFPKGRAQGSFGAGLVTAGLVVKAAVGSARGVLAPDKLQILLDGELMKGGEYHLAISTSLKRLFWGIQPFWGNEDSPVRFTAIANKAERFGAAVPGILRGRVKPWVTPEAGYMSRNVKCAELRLDSGFTVDGETFGPRPDEVVSITADHRVTFIRA